MNRPFYETSADRTHEQEVIDLFCSRFSLTPHKLKPSLIVDYALMDKDGICKYACEVKVRKKSYPELFISLAKVQALRAYQAIDVNARIFFVVPEGVYVQKIAPLHIEGYIKYGGRDDRGDMDDKELLVYYNFKSMTRMFDANPEWFK